MLTQYDLVRFFASLIGSAVVVYLATFAVISLACRFGITDEPGERKIHKRATPLLGGLAIYIGLVIGVASNFEYLARFLPLLAALTLVFVLGLIDDIRGLSAKTRLVFQIVAGCIVIASDPNARISFLPPTFFGDTLEIVVTLVWIVGVTNAFNYLDGMDGLATGSAVINLYFFTAILFAAGQKHLALFTAVAIGPCLGFLPHNFRKARIFLGDAGSTLLGFLIASVALAGNWASDSFVKIVIPILILGVPIFDMIFTTVMRIRDGKVKTFGQWLSYGGRDHFHHCLVDLGLKPMEAVLFIYLVTVSLGLSALMLSNDSAVEAVLTLSQAFIIFVTIAILIVAGRHHRHGWD